MTGPTLTVVDTLATEPPDRRRNLYRSDLADISLKGRVTADRFIEGTPAQICLPVVPVRREPDMAMARETEYLQGESVRVYDRANGWAWVQSQRDLYTGYIDERALAQDQPLPTHRVSVRSSHLYPAPDVKRFATSALSFGSRVTVVDRQNRWSRIADGQWIYSEHLMPVGTYESDAVSVAQRFLEAPYLWGGRSNQGLDCSAMVQFALEACGVPCPRDTDMQEREVGYPLSVSHADLQRGDLVFWPGHVGMMVNETHAIHANATDMAVRIWPLDRMEDHIRRVENLEIRSIRRLR
ncbi:C40 family peptidase [Rhodospirillaceae bacterium KN72]|uniref:C40 family peptidase n=1 Tax=Pacificispira spongiicola TaxID=2729598 RepID=A0A7Y0E434_9PROT|nr:NlpC/P60 family protein [Pacificispira spongiicola]NMM46066.1 C40 family peptidase [Pacificispira spongiicola]